MSARTTTEQRAQFGKEAVAGAAVPATTRLSNATLSMNPKVSSERVRASGDYFDSLVYLKDERSEGKIEGTPDYAGIADQLELIYGTPAVSAPTAGVEERVYTLGPVRKTWTVEQGDASNGEQYPGVFATGYEIQWGANSGDSKLTIDLVGGAMVDGFTLTAGTTATTPVPVTAAQVLVYLDPSQELLGTTQVAGVLATDIKVASIADLVKYFGSIDTVNTAPDATVELKLAVNTVAKQLLTDMRTSTTRYLRVVATGASIDGTTNETLTFDFAVQGEDQSRGDESNVYAATVPLRLVKDAAGFSHSVTLVHAAA